MTCDEMLVGLFPEGHEIEIRDGIMTGQGTMSDGRRAQIAGIADGTVLGIEGALALAAAVLSALRAGEGMPILVLVDSGSQRMRRRDELLGLNEYLAHLAKTLRLAEARGHPTLGVIHGHSAAGAFIATALATQALVGLPGANPTVMDLPSVARVTTLDLDRVEELARTTPVFAPGLDNMVAVGAVHGVLDPSRDIGEQVVGWLAELPERDSRDRLGAERGGRPRAAAVADMVVEAARAG